ncbi:MAG: hypothetical protein HQK49_18465 [Oligoflexia bacterium]|nr:hypothetical protein [Oligoflexia bacterium]
MKRKQMIKTQNHISLSPKILKFLFSSILISTFLLITFTNIGQTTDNDRKTKKWKILHIMSYHSPWQWTDDQLKGFQDALKEFPNIEYKVFQMDTKRKNSEEWKKSVGEEARNLITSWKPDLVYTNDDNAQEYVVKHYINSEIPFVFSGVNNDPAKYGFAGSKNITGILEQEHVVQTMNLLKKIIPKLKKIVVIFDSDISWNGLRQRMEEKKSEFTDFEIVSFDIIKTFEEFQHKIKELEGKVDAIGMIGIFNFKDKNGQNVPHQQVLKWTAENSNIPDFTFWEDRVDYGTLCSVTVSGYEQGFAAGEIAKNILGKGLSANAFPFKATVKGAPVINMARAKQLKLNINNNLVLSSKVFKQYAWDK